MTPPADNKAERVGRLQRDMKIATSMFAHILVACYADGCTRHGMLCALGEMIAREIAALELQPEAAGEESYLAVLDAYVEAMRDRLKVKVEQRRELAARQAAAIPVEATPAEVDEVRTWTRH